MSVNSELDSVRHILLYGPPGIGKTTVVMKVCERLTSLKLPLTGFYTKESRSANSRVGFDIITTDNKRGPLARIRSDGRKQPCDMREVPIVGKYEVDISSFESIALPALQLENSKSIVVIDEIGKMELFSSRFQDKVKSLFLDKDNLMILATVPSKNNITFVENLKRLKSTKMLEVNLRNRNDLAETLVNCIKNTYSIIHKSEEQ